jgi:hypothetical protein
VNTISTLLPRMQMNEQYTQPIATRSLCQSKGRDWMPLMPCILKL